jgi:predicted dehydrogenase
MNIKRWKIGILQDTSVRELGYHGLHGGFWGLPGADVVAHVDSNPVDVENRMGYGAKRHYLSYTEMLDKEKPDIAVLCSRNPLLHFEQIKEAAQRGIHVYCEKPMTSSLAEADQIIELADKYRIKICMAHPCRYALAFRTMKKMIEAGEIGTPVKIYGRGKCDHRGGGEDLLVLGTHILDLQTFFFGKPQYVMADVTNKGKPVVKTDRNETAEPLGPVAGDEVFAYFRFDNDVTGSFESWRGLFNAADKVVHLGITVIGTKGNISMRFNDNVPVESELHISRIPAPPEDLTNYEKVELTEYRNIPGAEPLDYSLCGKYNIHPKPMFLEANRFAAWDLMKAIQEDRLPISNQYNARMAQEMIYAIYESALSGQLTRFPLASHQHPLGEF